jgi:hypothetical protein
MDRETGTRFLKQAERHVALGERHIGSRAIRLLY